MLACNRSFWLFPLRRFGAPEAHKITGVFGRVTISIRHTKVNRRAAPASAAYDAPRVNGQKGIVEKKIASSYRVDLCVGVVRPPFVGQKFPDIPGHVEESVAVRRVASDCTGIFDATRGIVCAHRRGVLVAPRELFAVEPAARSILPLGFRRQTFSPPVAKGHGRVPAYIDNRVIRRALRIFVAVPVLEVVAVMKSCGDTLLRPLRILVNELLELRVGYRVYVDTERTHRYCVPWDFGRE